MSPVQFEVLDAELDICKFIFPAARTLSEYTTHDWAIELRAARGGGGHTQSD